MCDPFQVAAMSGEIFQPLETFEEQVESGRGPLTCRLCTQQYEDPRILDCYHVFCGNCLRGRAVDGFMTCPLCGGRSFLTNGSVLPPADPIFTFLLKSSEQERAACANCDSVQSSMFFCNTCGQALCEACKEETHRAKMFASHQLISLTRRTKEQHRKCSKHRDEFIMFSTEKQELLCIKCFRDFDKEGRSYCLDVESAYHQSCTQLAERISTIQGLQSAVHDAIILFQALMQEVRSNAEKERISIQELCAQIQDSIAQKKEELLKDVDSQHQQKEQAFKDQLPSLAALLPTLQLYLAISTMFVNSANMYEFLDLSSSLNDRLESIINKPHRLRPQESSEISTNYESQFASCVKPLLMSHMEDYAVCGTSSPIIHVSMPTAAAQTVPQMPARSRANSTTPPPPMSSAYISSALARHFSLATTLQIADQSKGVRRGTKMAAALRHRAQEGNGPFVEHCKAFEANFRLLQHRIQKMKEQVQEIHRDITRRKCQAKKEKVVDVLDECSQVEIQISTHTATLEHMKIIFEKIWQETLDRVSNEQDIYQTQLKEMNYLKQETSHLATIARQIAPYISSIDTVAKQIDPRSRPTSPHESDDETNADDAAPTTNCASAKPEESIRSTPTTPIIGLKEKQPNVGVSTVSERHLNVSDGKDVETSRSLDRREDASCRSLRSLSEQEEHERLRAKKIVMDAIWTDQSKQTGNDQQPSTSKTNAGNDSSDVGSSRKTVIDTKHALKDTSEILKTGYAPSMNKLLVCTGGEVVEGGKGSAKHSYGEEKGGQIKEEEKVASGNHFQCVNGGSNVVSVRLCEKQAPKDSQKKEEEEKEENESDTEVSVSVSSRVKRFSLNEDQVESLPRPISPGGLPRTSDVIATNKPKRMVIKRSEPEVQTKRSFMNVTMTTSESDNTEAKGVLMNGKEASKRPITDETENIVLRVRNRRKMKEKGINSPGSS